MQYTGILTKMQTEDQKPIQYYLIFKDNFININQLINKTIEIRFLAYECLSCQKAKKIFRQGFCYECYYKSAKVGDWIFRPELSTAHLNIEDRDLDYEKKMQLQPHIVYLASSHEIKVGVTRKTQVPTRWIDQGASEVIEVLEVPNRYLAGITEVALKNYFTDKTNWRKMLQNDLIETNLFEEKSKLEKVLPNEVKEFFNNTENKQYLFEYPVIKYPKRITSLNLETTTTYTGILIGIKGQYLLFEEGTVFNVRNHEGFIIDMKIFS